MTEKKLISIIIPTYNRPKYLQKAIETIIKQTYSNFEIIIIDDASTLDSKNIVESFKDKRIRYFRNEKRRGAPFSRNQGIDKAKGELIAFLDDDDEWMSTKLEDQLKLFNNEKLGLVVCYSLDKRFGNERISKPSESITYKDLLKSFNLSSTSSYLVRRKALDKVGYFDLNLPSGQEYDIALRISKYYDVKTLPKLLMIQNSSEGQISENWGKKIRGIIALYKKYSKDYKILGCKGCIINHIKNLGLFFLFFLGFILGNKIYKIIIPVKEIYEK